MISKQAARQALWGAVVVGVLGALAYVAVVVGSAIGFLHAMGGL